MSERIVDDPSQHGWVDAGNGKWEWVAGGGSAGGGGDPEWAKVDTNGTAIGVNASAEQRGGAYGQDSVATGLCAIAIGYESRSEYEDSIAIGEQSTVNGPYGIALGYQAQAEDFQFKICDLIEEVQFGKAELRTNSVSAEYYRDADGNDVMQTLTQAEYDALTPNANTVYFIV